MRRWSWGLLFAAGFLTAAFAGAQDSLLPVIISTPSLSTAPIHTSTEVCPSTGVWRTVPNKAFSVGESLSFVIKWGIVTAGSSSLTIQDIKDIHGRPAYHLVEEARSTGFVDTFYKVRDRHDVWLDTQSLTTVQYDKKVREGSYRVEETVRLDQACHYFYSHSYRVDKKLYEDKQGSMPPDILDPLGSLYYVRNLPLEVGQIYSIDVYSGEKVYPMALSVKKRERVKVPAGTFDTILVEPLIRGPGIFISKGKKLEVWLTDDDRRMPVRMRSEVFIGHVAAELVSYHLPTTPP